MTATVYAYAFVPDPAPELQDLLEAIEGLYHRIQIIRAGSVSVAAAVEVEVDLDAIQSSDQVLLRAALRHDQVICQLFEHLPVIPLRFGTGFVSLDKLRWHLQEQASTYQKTLTCLAGRAEYLLKVSAPPQPDPDPVSAPSGTAYLMARRQAYQEQQTYLQTLEQTTQQLLELWPADWPRQALTPQDGEQLRMTFLLDPGQYQAALKTSVHWQSDQSGWCLKWGSGVPPYHFAQGMAEDF